MVMASVAAYPGPGELGRAVEDEQGQVVQGGAIGQVQGVPGEAEVAHQCHEQDHEQGGTHHEQHHAEDLADGLHQEDDGLPGSRRSRRRVNGPEDHGGGPGR